VGTCVSACVGTCVNACVGDEHVLQLVHTGMLQLVQMPVLQRPLTRGQIDPVTTQLFFAKTARSTTTISGVYKQIHKQVCSRYATNTAAVNEVVGLYMRQTPTIKVGAYAYSAGWRGHSYNIKSGVTAVWSTRF